MDVASNFNRCLAKTFGKNAPILDKDWLRRCLALVVFNEDAEQNTEDDRHASHHLGVGHYCGDKVHGGDAHAISPKTDLLRQFTLRAGN